MVLTKRINLCSMLVKRLNEGFFPLFYYKNIILRKVMYNLPATGPSFLGHILISFAATVVIFFRKSFKKLLHKNG